jgi:hypothetical protein
MAKGDPFTIEMNLGSVFLEIVHFEEGIGHGLDSLPGMRFQNAQLDLEALFGVKGELVSITSRLKNAP